VKLYNLFLFSFIIIFLVSGCKGNKVEPPAQKPQETQTGRGSQGVGIVKMVESHDLRQSRRLENREPLKADW